MTNALMELTPYSRDCGGYLSMIAHYPKNFHLHLEGCKQVKEFAPSFEALAGKEAVPDACDDDVVPSINTPKFEIKISFNDQ